MALSEKVLCKKRVKLAIGIVLGLYTVIISAIAYFNWQEKGADFAELVDNWKYVPFNNYSLSTLAAGCSGLGAGWFKVPLKAADFPGATPFCNCPPSATNGFANQQTYNGNPSAPCFTNQTNAGCSTVPSTPAQQVSWYGKILCGHRLGNAANEQLLSNKLNAINRPRAFGVSPTCPAGFKVCPNAGGSVTVKTEWTCAPTADLCPVTKVDRVSNADANGAYGATTGTVCLPNDSWGTGSTLCYRRSGTLPPLVRAEDAQNYTCFPGNSRSAERTQTDFRLGSKSICGKQDTRWSIFSRINEQVLYQDTTLPAIWKQKANPAIDYVLSSRVEITWNANCTSNRQRLVDLEPDVDRLTKAQLAVLVINILVALFYNCFYNFWEFKQEDDPDDFSDDSAMQVKIRKFRICCASCMELCKVIPLAIALAMAINLRSTFNDMKENPCTTEAQTQDTIDFFATETKKQANLNIALLAGVLVSVLLELYDCYKFWRVDHPKDENTDVEIPRTGTPNYQPQY